MSRSSGTCSEKTSFWLGDTVLVLFLFFPLMVFYWRGIWDLVGVYIFPTAEEHLKQCWTIIGIGSGTIFGYALHPMVDKATRPMSRYRRAVVVRIYMAVYAVLPMAYWRGVWTAADYYLDQYGWHAAVIGYFLCAVILHVCRASQTAIFPPFFVALDTRPEVLVVSTRFRVKPSVTLIYLLDAFFSHFVVLTLTILMWRSAWTCVDSFFIPHDYFLSNIASLCLGYGACALLLFSDPILVKITKVICNAERRPSHQFYALLVWEDAVYILVFWCHLFIWRGAWNLNADYIIPDFEVGGWVNNMVGTVGFLIFQIYSYVGACGCVVDGHIDGTEDRWFSTNYLPTVFPFIRKLCSRMDGEETESSKTDLDKEGHHTKTIDVFINEGFDNYQDSVGGDDCTYM